MCQTKNEITW